MLYEIFADCSLGALLIVAIAYCRKLEIRLRRMRRGESTMLEAAERLDRAVADARGVLVSLNAVAARDLSGFGGGPGGAGVSDAVVPASEASAPLERALRRRFG